MLDREGKAKVKAMRVRLVSYLRMALPGRILWDALQKWVNKAEGVT